MDLEIKVFLKSTKEELKDVIGINFEKCHVYVKSFFKNKNRSKIDGYYHFDDVYFEVIAQDKKLTINKITTVGKTNDN